MKKYKIYICHYPPLTERKKYLDTVIPYLNIDFEYSTDYTSYKPTHENFFSKEHNDLVYKNNLSCVKCYDFNLTPALKALCLEHVNIYNKIINENIDYGIIFEDDAIFVDDIKSKIHETLKHIPNDADVIYMTNGCGGREIYLNNNANSVNNFIKMSVPYSWTAGAYIIKKETAQLFRDNIMPLVFPPDFELNYLQNRFQSTVYWLKTPIVYEGSNPVSGDLFRYNSSVNR